MGSLGYNVPLHRTMAFGFAGVRRRARWASSSSGGTATSTPASINIGAAIDLLVIGVIGGLYRLEGAWVGAIAFVVIQNYVRTDDLPVVGGTFHTLIGVIFLAHRARLPGRTDGDLGLAASSACARPRLPRSGSPERRRGTEGGMPAGPERERRTSTRPTLHGHSHIGVA